MKRINLTPTKYHELTFNARKLPDIAAAGPVSASILSRCADAISFLSGADKKPSAAMQWGSLVDCRWLTPLDFSNQYAILPDNAPPDKRRFADAKKPSQDTLDSIAWWNNFEQLSANKIPVPAKDMEDVDAAVSMLQQHDLAMELFDASDKQVALMGQSPIHPLAQAKCLFDMLPLTGPFSDSVVDLKTSNDVSDHAIQSTIFTYEYHMKMAYYSILAQAAGFGRRPRSILIWQRSKFPYDVHVREIDRADLVIGGAMAVNRMNSLLRMTPNDMRPHFDLKLSTVPMADWMRNRCLEQ